MLTQRMHMHARICTCTCTCTVGRYHIGYHDDALLKFCLDNKIIPQAWSPMGGGQLPRETSGQ